jgi:cytosine/adenosine deaminase-related metal-dependent hydrolase
MRKFTADRVLLPNGHLEDGIAVVFHETGKVIDILPASQAGDLEIYKGILCPGFINTHCHLELSHLAGKIPRGTTLPGFIRDFVKTRQVADSTATTPAATAAAATSAAATATAASSAAADFEMWQSGIQAVGDICNRIDTIEIKERSKIRYHSFVEVFGLDTEKSEKIFENGQELKTHFVNAGCSASVVPHAPYSMSPALFKMIRDHHTSELWTIHSQESDAERELFETGRGIFHEMFRQIGLDTSILPSGTGNSLRYIANHFPETGNLLLVHNTFTGESDIDFLKEKGFFSRTWFALCPKANLYIENRLPDISMMRKNDCNITIGTDSLASNDRLDIVDELKTISRLNPEINSGELLMWATENGADYFGWKDLGRFTKNSNPGCVRIECGENHSNASKWVFSERIL